MYIDLVLCKHDGNNNNFLFYAPAWSNLKEGDRVIVNTQYGESDAVVVATNCVEYKDDDYNFIIKATGATKPLRKVLKKVEYRELNYNCENLDLVEENENGVDND